MPCHIVRRYPPQSLCGVDFSELKEPHLHTYVDSLSRRLEMVNCQPCLREHHEEELEKLGGWDGPEDGDLWTDEEVRRES